MILGLIHSALNTMAGAGDTRFSMISMILMMALRVLLAWLFIRAGSLGRSGIWWSFPASWALTLLFVLHHYRSGAWMKKALAKNA